MTLQSFSTNANRMIMNTLHLLFFALLTLFLSTCDSDVSTFQPDRTFQAVVLDENSQPIRDARVAYLPVLVQPFSSIPSSLTATLDTTVVFTNDTITIRAKALSPGTLSVALLEQQPTPPVSGQSPTDIGVMRISHYYWTIQPDANLSISHVTIDVRYSLPFLHISEPTYVVWLHRDSSGGDWKVLPTAVVGNQLRGTLPPNPFGEVALAALPQDIICFPTPMSFTSTPTAEGIRLNWETTHEYNLAGFQVIRNGELLADYQRESALRSKGLITVIGRPYAFIDATAQPNQTYTYQLRSVSNLGYVENLFPTLTATPMRNADASSLRIS